MFVPTLLTHLVKAAPASNPISNPAVFAALSPSVQSQVVEHAPLALAANPALPVSASMRNALLAGGSPMAAGVAAAVTAAAQPATGTPGPGSGAGNAPGTWAGPSPTNPYGYAGWENTNSLNPAVALQRKPWPVQLLPMSGATNAAGAVTLTAQPQNDFQGFLMIFPSVITSTGYVSQIQVGTRLVNIASGNMPIECFSEKNDARRFDFPYARATQQISVTVTGGPASTTLYCIILGYVPGAPGYSNAGASPGRSGILPFGSTTLAASASATVTLTPQERFKLRRICLNSQQTNFGNILITSFQIGTRVESVQSASYPAAVYSDLAIDDWVDFDVCPKNTQIAITVTNSNTTASAIFEGFGTGDVWYDDEASQAA